MKYSIAIVDDEEMMRRGLTSMIPWDKWGFEVVISVDSGRALIRWLQEQTVDVVLTDIAMEDVSGLDVARYIHENMAHTVTVVISGYPDFDFARQAMDYGVYKYLLKPVSIDDMRTLMEDVRSEIERRSRISLLEKKFQTMKNNQDPIQQARSFILSNFSQDITLSRLSEEVHMAPAYLSRLFHEKTGETYIDYLNGVRLNAAAELLKDRNLTLADISMRVGFRDQKYFTRRFKMRYGVTPSEYRDRGE